MGALRKLVIAGTMVVAFAVSVVVATAEEDGSSTLPEGGDPVSAVEPDAREALAVLEEDREPVDALPGDVSEAFVEEGEFGVNPYLSRLARGNATHSVFVIPARGHVCIAFTTGPGAILGCRDTDLVAAGQAGPGTAGLPGGAVGIYGLVPDGVESVTVDAGAEPIRVPVADNVYYTVVPDGTPLRTLSYEGPSGTSSFPLYDPHAGTTAAGD